MSAQETAKQNTFISFAKAAALVSSLVFSAFLMTVALRSADGRWLGWITLLPLFLSIRVLSPSRALLAGALWGLCLAVFSSLNAAAIATPTLRWFALLTLVPGVYAALGSVVTRRAGFSPLLLGLGWVGVELALQPLARHNGLLAATQGDGGLVVRSIGMAAGYLLVAFLVAYVNASFVEILGNVVAVASAPRTIRGTSNHDGRLLPPVTFAYVAHFFGRDRQTRAPPAVA